MTLRGTLVSVKLTPQERAIVEHFAEHGNPDCLTCTQAMTVYYEKRTSKPSPIQRS